MIICRGCKLEHLRVCCWCCHRTCIKRTNIGFNCLQKSFSLRVETAFDTFTLILQAKTHAANLMDSSCAFFMSRSYETRCTSKTKDCNCWIIFRTWHFRRHKWIQRNFIQTICNLITVCKIKKSYLIVNEFASFVKQASSAPVVFLCVRNIGHSAFTTVLFKVTTNVLDQNHFCFQLYEVRRKILKI